MRIVIWKESKDKRGNLGMLSPTHVIHGTYLGDVVGNWTRCGTEVPMGARVRRYTGGAVVPCQKGCWTAPEEG